MDVEVLYLDNHLLALHKPAGLLTQPSGTDKDNLEDRGKAFLKDKFNKPGNVFLTAVHRLDAPVSGVVLFARTSKALSRLQEASRNREFEKTYLAWVQGRPPKDEDRLVHFLAHRSRRSEVVGEKDAKAKKSVLTYRLLKKEADRSLLQIQLETGRYHQIRCQLAAVGCPILGDEKYGAVIQYGAPGIALHHRLLVGRHPVSGESITIEAPWAYSEEAP